MKKVCLFVFSVLSTLAGEAQVGICDPDSSLTETISLSNVSLCVNEEDSLTYEITGTNFTDFNAEWYWLIDEDFELMNQDGTNTSVDGTTLSTTIEVPTGTPLDDVEYYVLLTNNGSEYCQSEVLEISINPLPDTPTFPIGAEGLVFCEGDSMMVINLTSSNISDSLGFYLNNVSQTNDALLTDGNYYPFALNTATGCESNLGVPIEVEILDTPTASLNLTGEDSFCIGDELPLLTVENESADSVNVEVNWINTSTDESGTELLQEVNESLEIFLGDIIQGVGVYEFDINTVSYLSDPTCLNPIDDNSISITVNDIPPPPQVPDNLELQAFCSGSDPTVNDLSLPDGANQWFVNDVEISGSEELDELVSYFPAQVINSSGCYSVSSEFVEVELVPDPSFEILSDNEICSGDTVDISLSSPEFVDYFCVSSNEPDADVQFIGEGEGCSETAESVISAQITVTTSSSELIWDGEVTAYNIAENDPNVQCPVTLNIDPIQVSVAPAFHNTQDTITACIGDTVIINPEWNGIGDTNEWDVADLLSNTSIADSLELSIFPSDEIVPGEEYTATISGQSGSCYAEFTYVVSYYDLPPLESKIIDDPEFCHGEYNTIQIINPNPDFTYVWDCVNCDEEFPLEDSSLVNIRWLHPDFENSDSPANAEYIVTATSNITGCSSRFSQSIEIQNEYASCPEGIAFFEPNGLSITDFPANYFQWGTLDGDLNFVPIDGQTNQTYFPTEDINACDPEQYVVRSSLYSDRCWTTTIYCYYFDAEATPKDCAFERSLVVNDTDIDAFPNPNNGKEILLREINGSADEQFQLSLYDLTGKIIYTTQIEIVGGGDTNVPLPNLVQGLYVLRLSNESTEHSLKIIVN